MQLSDFYYDLPEELIAQKPIPQRDQSRLLCLDRNSGEISHKKFFNIVDFFEKGDCIVLNDSRVIHARLFAKRCDTGADAEIFLIKPLPQNRWECMVRPGKKVRKGKTLYIEDVKLLVEDELENGNRVIFFECEGDLDAKLKNIGEIPLPPYIHEKLEDTERYQTIYAKSDGSVAAPTAGLHFTDEVLTQLKNKGVNICYVTLHVGIGTFRPVKVTNITEHKMHSEYYIFTQSSADVINNVKKAGGKVCAVGTTACRVLETVGQKFDGILAESFGETDAFIYPGYKFKIIDRLITNFHLPESTLIMLVSAFAGRDFVMEAYKEAIKERYRFFSFGDAMLIL